MKIVNIHEAKTSLSKLIARAAHGEEIIIGKAGKPVAKLTAFDLEAKPRVPGVWRGKIAIARDFDQLPSRILKLFNTPSL
jgi:prevent-host-death family protein